MNVRLFIDFKRSRKNDTKNSNSNQLRERSDSNQLGGLLRPLQPSLYTVCTPPTNYPPFSTSSSSGSSGPLPHHPDCTVYSVCAVHPPIIILLSKKKPLFPHPDCTLYSNFRN